MKNKIASTFIIVSIFTIAPLMVRPVLMLNIEWIIVFTSLIVLFLTQPPLKFNEVRIKSTMDKYSILLILFMCGTSTIAPIIEWAYHRNGQSTKGLFFVIGLFLLISGFIIRTTAIKMLGTHFTATVQITNKHKLITNGLYKFIRHPSYLGAFLTFVGISFILESWLGLVIAVVSMMVAYHVRISVEEKTLLHYFGNDYATYQRRTKKMFPYIW